MTRLTGFPSKTAADFSPLTQSITELGRLHRRKLPSGNDQIDFLAATTNGSLIRVKGAMLRRDAKA